MKEVLFKKNGSNFFNSTFYDFNPLDDSDNFHRKKKVLIFKQKEVNNSEEFYLQNYGNQMVSIGRENVMIVVEKTENKVSIKLFTSSRYRRAGVTWFKINTKVTFISVNKKTGDVYSGTMTNYHKKRKFTRVIRRNYFFGNPLKDFMSYSKNMLNQHFYESGSIINEAVSIFMTHIDEKNDLENLSPNQRLLKFYLDKRKVKYPNNFSAFYKIPTSDLTKQLKKTDNKLVDAFMRHHELSGKKLKKILHLSENLNVICLKTVKYFFGADWLNQDEEMILSCLNSSEIILSFPPELKEIMTEEEKRRVYNILKQVIIYNNIDSWTFNDHLRLYCELKDYGENVKWISKNGGKDFRDEHLDWSDKMQYYKNGFYTRIYSQTLYDKICKPIDGYYPVILNDTTSYNEESSIQNNCVKTYIGRPSSFIISLRKDSPNSDERATIEYQINSINNKIETQRVQTLGKYNQKLSSDWDNVLLKLDKVVLSSVKEKNFEIVKITKKCLNGSFFSSDTYWDENGILRWTFKKIENSGYY